MLNMQQKKVIGLFLPTSTLHIDSQLIQAIKQYYDLNLYHLVVVNIGIMFDANLTEDNKVWYYQRLKSLKFNAVIVYGIGKAFDSNPNILMQITEFFSNVPLINIGKPLPFVPSVYFDNKQVTSFLMRHLIEVKGCRTFAVLNGPKNNHDATERRLAVLKSLLDYGLSLNSGYDWQGDYYADNASLQVKRFLQTGLALPDVIVCANDLSARGVIDELMFNNIKVPQQVKVTGFDNYDFSDHHKVAITTVQHPINQMAKVAYDLIDSMLLGNFVKNKNVVSTEVILRESTGDASLEQRQRKSMKNYWYNKDLIHHSVRVARRIEQYSELSEALIFLSKELAVNGLKKFFVFENFDVLGQLCSCHFLENGNYKKGLYQNNTIDGLSHILSNKSDPSYLLMVCPLVDNKQCYGFVVCEVKNEIVEIVEFVADLITDVYVALALKKKTQQLQTKVSNSNKMASVGALVSPMSHELNTPLGVSLMAISNTQEELVKLNSDLCAGALSKQQLLQWLQLSKQSTDIVSANLLRASELIDSFNFLTSKKTSVQIEKVALDEVINRTLLCLSPMFKASQVAVKTQFQQQVNLKTDAGAWSHIITNLMLNAHKHAFDDGHKPGEIFVSIKIDKVDAVVSIRDNGSGIENKEVGKIFNAYYTTAKDNGGTGLGLNIVKQIVETRLNASISVQSQVNKGSDFIIRCPLTQVEQSKFK